MFNGIIYDLGRVIERKDSLNSQSMSIKIQHTFLNMPKRGASIAVNGVCLTVTDIGDDWFCSDISHETLQCTNLSQLAQGAQIHLESSVKLGDEIGGHFFTGHVDGCGVLTNKRLLEGGHMIFEIEVSPYLSNMLAPKGSVALNGVSLTINTIKDVTVSLNLIPETIAKTLLEKIDIQGRINIEIDPLMRYVARAVDTYMCNHQTFLKE